MIAAVFAVALVTPVFAKMYRDFGTTPSRLTTIVLLPWFPLAVGAVPALVWAYTVATPGLDASLRRRLLWLAFALAAIAWVTCVGSLSFPEPPIMAR